MLNLHDILPIIYLTTNKPAISVNNDYNCSVLFHNFHCLLEGNTFWKTWRFQNFLGKHASRPPTGSHHWRSGFHNCLLYFPSHLLQKLLKALQEFFQVINFHFTQTTEHQPTGNLHSSTRLFAIWSLWRIYFRHVQEETQAFASTRNKMADSLWCPDPSPHFKALVRIVFNHLQIFLKKWLHQESILNCL